MKSNKIDKFDFVQMVLQAKISSNVTEEDYESLIAIYEKAIQKEIRNNCYSPTMNLTTEQRKKIKAAM